MTSFKTIKVSPRIHALLQAHEAACTTLGLAMTRDDVDDAFTRVSLAREAVYQYVESLEQKDHTIDRTCVLRF